MFTVYHTRLIIVLNVKIFEGGLLQNFIRSEKGLIKKNTKMKRSSKIFSLFKDKKNIISKFFSLNYLSLIYYLKHNMYIVNILKNEWVLLGNEDYETSKKKTWHVSFLKREESKKNVTSVAV